MALDRFRKAIRRLAASPEERYYGFYVYTVTDAEVTGGATLLQLRPEVEGMPALTNIQWVFPLPNISFASASPTTKVLVGFFEGDPSKPYAFPIFLAGMIGDVIMNTGTYRHNVQVLGNEATATYTLNVAGNVTISAVDSRPFNYADMTLTADGNILMNVATGGKAVVVNSGTRLVARKDDPVTLNLELSVIAPFGGGPCTVTWVQKSATVGAGTSKLKVPND